MGVKCLLNEVNFRVAALAKLTDDLNLVYADVFAEFGRVVSVKRFRDELAHRRRYQVEVLLEHFALCAAHY